MLLGSKEKSKYKRIGCQDVVSRILLTSSVISTFGGRSGKFFSVYVPQQLLLAIWMARNIRELITLIK